MTILHLRSQTNIRRVHTMCTRKHFLRIIRYDSTTFIFPRSPRRYNRPPYVHTTDRTNISSTYFRPTFAPILANLSIMNIEDISTSHHAENLAAGTDSTLAKKACVALRDKLSQIARTRTLQDDTLDAGGNVCRRTKEDEIFTLESFKEGWKNRARACAVHNRYPRGWSKLSNADKLTSKKYFEKCGGQFPESTMDEVKPVTTDKPSAKKRRVRVPAKDLEAFRAFQKARKSQHESPVLE